ncbi:MAG: alpha/beta hydrolase [Verrucomicrobiales bacterium]|nr:alpha/beta hydrolase [Verrucomicrobiales bacterium]
MNSKALYIFTLLLTSQILHAQSNSPDQKVAFKKFKESSIKLHVFKPAKWKSSDKRTAIIFFFGGGWTGGTPKQFYPHCRHLSKKGLIAISAEYRTKKSHNVEPMQCVEDGKSAIRWVRANANLLGIDPNKVVAAGGSAGGHVAACTGTITGFESGDLKFSSVPAALILFNPVCDTSPAGYGNNRLGKNWKKISPLHHINKKTPPTCIFHGSADTTVPINNVLQFKKRMDEIGLRCELHSYDGEKHGFFNFGRGDGTAYSDTVSKMDSFLESLGLIGYPDKKNKK